MGILSILLLVAFVIIAILLILLVLVQNEEGDSLGGIFAGGSASAFGSRSGNVLTRTTAVLGFLFLTISFFLAFINRTPGGAGVEEAGLRQAAEQEQGTEWYREDDSGASVPNDGQTLNIPGTEGATLPAAPAE
ncbi:MAG: preprotein translocase subunit SecG [Treponema sp.]|jgi:preprotein translocase subunit SecG|nr:preprotein translocase subunit SecG [Treponema sp.]